MLGLTVFPFSDCVWMKTHWPRPSNRKPGLRLKMQSVTWDPATRRNTEIHPNRTCKVNYLSRQLSAEEDQRLHLLSHGSLLPFFCIWKEASSPALMTARWLLSIWSVTRQRSADEDANLQPKRCPTSQPSSRWRWKRRRPQVWCSLSAAAQSLLWCAE